MIVEKLKKSLIEKRDELNVRIYAIENDFKKGRSQDFAEHCTESENDEVLDEIHHQAKIELQKITQTLAMLETEQYGVCIECGKNIPEQRMQALAYAKTCVNCSTD